MKLKIIEKKNKIQKEINRKKNLYNKKLQSIFSNKGLNNRSVKIIRKMFPDNEKINELIDSYRTNNLKKLRTLSQSNILNNNSISQSREINKSYININKKLKKNDISSFRNYNDKTNRSVNLLNHSPNQFSFYLTSIDNKKNINDKIDIRNFFNKNNNISFESNENLDNSFENNYSKKSCEGNEKKKFRQLKEKEIINKVNQFKKELNKDLEELILKEKQKEELREKNLNNIKTHNEKKKLEKTYEIERIKASDEIIKKNEEIEKKIKKYESNLRFGIIES